MTTRLKRAVTRIVEIDGKMWNVTLGPSGLTFREYRRRLGFLLPYSSAMHRAVLLYVEQEQREKIKGRRRS